MKIDIHFKDVSLEKAKRLIDFGQTFEEQLELPLFVQNEQGEAVQTDFVADNTAVVENVTEEDISEIDAEGLCWDARIHSSNKKKTAKGVWQRRRGVSDEAYEAIKAEILQSSAPAPVAAPAMPAMPSARCLRCLPLRLLLPLLRCLRCLPLRLLLPLLKKRMLICTMTFSQKCDRRLLKRS